MQDGAPNTGGGGGGGAYNATGGDGGDGVIILRFCAPQCTPPPLTSESFTVVSAGALICCILSLW
jgi:hypothetical protein